MFTIAARASEAKSSMKPIFKQVLGNKRLRIETRMMLTQSLVLSRSTYNSHIWSELRIGEIRKFKSEIMSMLRRVAGMQSHAESNDHHNDAAVLAETMAMSPEELLAIGRL